MNNELGREIDELGGKFNRDIEKYLKQPIRTEEYDHLNENKSSQEEINSRLVEAGE